MQIIYISRILVVMEELVFDKKKYISSKRAAKISGYTKDYIGQLCRAEVLPAKMVGRNWYIEEGALKEHRKTYQGESIVDQSVWDIDHVEEGSRSLSEIAQQYIGEGEIKKRNELIDQLFSLTYAKDEGDLLPSLKKQAQDHPQNTVDSSEEEKEGIDEELVAINYPKAIPSPLRKSSHVLSLHKQKRIHPASPPPLHLQVNDEYDTRNGVVTSPIPTLQSRWVFLKKIFIPTLTFLCLLVTGTLLLENRSFFYHDGLKYIKSEDGIVFTKLSDFVRQIGWTVTASPNNLD